MWRRAQRDRRRASAAALATAGARTGQAKAWMPGTSRTSPGMTKTLRWLRRTSRGDRFLRHQSEEGVLEAGAALAGWAAQLLERALGDETAAGDDADAVGHALGDFEDMRGHDDGAAGAHALAQHGLDLARRAGVEPGQRLVEDDQPGLVHQRAGERHLLPHALGERLTAFMAVRAEAEPVDKVARARLGGRGVDAPQAGDEFEILEGRQLVVDHRLVGEPRHDLFRRRR